VFTVINRVEIVEAQQLGQPARVALVGLVAFLMEAFFRGSHTTKVVTRGFRRSYNQAAEVPSSKGPAVSGQPLNLQNHAGFGLDDPFHHDLSCTIYHRNRNAFLVHIHADMLFATH
jgi:hypothetical protein